MLLWTLATVVQRIHEECLGPQLGWLSASLLAGRPMMPDGKGPPLTDGSWSKEQHLFLKGSSLHPLDRLPSNASSRVLVAGETIPRSISGLLSPSIQPVEILLLAHPGYALLTS